MAKISVIIPVYNAEKYISRCLESVITQNFDDIEIICVNDNSQDSSKDILKLYCEKDSRIKVIDNEDNIGAASTRNKGIDAANSEYIYFIDADDYIEQNYLGEMFAVINSKKCDIVLNLSVNTCSNDKLEVYKHPSMPDICKNGEYIDNITAIQDAPCFIWSRLYRKSLIDKYNLRFFDVRSDDVAFNAITSLYAQKIFAFYGPKYNYTIINSGMIGMLEIKNIKDLEHIKAYNVIYDYLKQNNKLDSKLKLFRVYPFFKVDTEEKFDYYKMFFEKIKGDYLSNIGIYNALEKFFADSILNSISYNDYLNKYNKIVTIGFIRRGKYGK